MKNVQNQLFFKGVPLGIFIKNVQNQLFIKEVPLGIFMKKRAKSAIHQRGLFVNWYESRSGLKFSEKIQMIRIPPPFKTHEIGQKGGYP